MMTTSPQRIWTASFVSISLTQLMVFAVFYSLIAALPLYVVNELGGSAAQAGLMITLTLIPQVLIRFVAEPFFQRIGRKRGLVLSIAFFAVITFAYAWVDTIPALYVLRLLHGIPFGIITTATGSIAATVVPAGRRGEGIGYFSMAAGAAVVIGPSVTLMLLQRISFTALFIVLGLAAVASIAVALVVQLPAQAHAPRVTASARSDPRNRKSINDFIETKALPVSAVMGVITMAYAGITAFVPVFAETLDLSAAAAFFFVVYAVAMMITRPYVGKRYDRRGPSSVIVPGLVLYATGFAVLSQTSTSWVLLASATLIGLGYGALQPSMQTMALQSTSATRAGYATATFFTFFDTGIAIGSVILGIVVDAHGFRALYAASAILVLLVIGLYVRIPQARREAAPPIEPDLLSERSP